MLRTGLAANLVDRHGDAGTVFPAYADYSFANVNPTVLSLLGFDAQRRLPGDVFEGVETDVDRVVVLFLDGYGWEHWQRDHGDVPFLSALTETGRVTPLTSTYPSETAAATTTFHTGLTPVEHGLLGWWQYVEEIDAVLEPLPFTTLAGDPVDEVYPDVGKALLCDAPGLYERARDAGVDCRLHQPFPTDEPWTGAADAIRYDTVDELGVQLRRGVGDPDGPEYLYAYVPALDTAAHRFGTSDPRYRADLETVTETLRRELVEKTDSGAAERTLVVVTADHGIVDTVPDENVDISSLDAVWENLRTDADGDPIPPVGSPRNLHLFLRDGTVERVRSALESRLPCRTFTRAEAVERGLFGDREPSDRFRRRCGDLVVIHRDRGVWYDAAELELVGMHGGLTREEMLVPFAVAPLAAL